MTVMNLYFLIQKERLIIALLQTERPKQVKIWGFFQSLTVQVLVLFFQNMLPYTKMKRANNRLF